MLEKLKSDFKENWKFYGLILLLTFVTMGVALVNYSADTGDHSLNFPHESTYGVVYFCLIIFAAIYAVIVLKKANNNGVRLERLYLWIAIPVGIIMCIVNPLGKIPDEDHHSRKAMAMSIGNIFSEVDEDGRATEMLNAKLHELVTRSVTNYDDAWRRLTAPETEGEVLLDYNTMALYAPICHAPQAFGMFLTRIMGFGVSVQCYAARLFNFSLAIFLLYNAIKFMPYKKNLMMVLALLPIANNVLPTMSSDALAISMCMFFIAYILHLKYDDNITNYSLKHYIIMAVSSFVIALCKIVYLPLCLIFLVLPKEKFGTMKKKVLFIFVVVLISVILNLVWLGYCSRFLVEFNAGVNSKDQVIFILTHPIRYCTILFKTINFYFNTYISGICGDALGTYNVKATELLIYPCIALLSILFFSKTEDAKIKFDAFTKIIFAGIFIIIAVLVYTSLYVQWTPVAFPLIIGVQPRYFFPVLIMTAVVFENGFIEIKEKMTRGLLTFLLFFNINVAVATIYTYYFGNLITGYIK